MFLYFFYLSVKQRPAGKEKFRKEPAGAQCPPAVLSPRADDTGVLLLSQLILWIGKQQGRWQGREAIPSLL